MSVENLSGTSSSAKSPKTGDRLGMALLVIATAQLMIVLDNTIVNIALPSIQQGLNMSPVNLAWVVTAYTLPFGGLLLVGGRAGDLFGRRKVFKIGLLVFILGSAVGGFAPNQQTLIIGRVLQGIGSAIAAPTALSLLATTFPAGPARNKALGVYGAMGGLGSVVGLLLGGVLTELLNWRWVLFVNIPIAIVVLLGTGALAEGQRERGRVDIPGAVTVTLGMTSLVYAVTRANTHGWGDAVTVAFLVAAAALLAIFLIVQVRSPIAMMPLRVISERNRAGANLTFLFFAAGMFATYYFLTLYMQGVKGYSAIQTGLAYLPMAFGVLLGAGGIGPRLLGRSSPRVATTLALGLAVLGMAWFSLLTPDSSYLGGLLPAMIVTGTGLGLTFVSTTIAGVSSVAPQDTGIASGLLNTSQQIGGSIGLPVLTTIAASVTASALASGTNATGALTDGYTTAIIVGGAFYLAALVIAVSTINIKTPSHPEAHQPEVPTAA